MNMFVKDMHIFLHPVYEQRDAAECIEKILTMTSPVASQVRSLSISNGIVWFENNT